jgi:hypothetical protein
MAAFTAVAFADEVLVFVDGSQMKVESYEIRGHTVVFTTLEGKLRSVPLSYVDVATMKGASKAAVPAEESTAPVVQPVAAEPIPVAHVSPRDGPTVPTKPIANHTDARLGKAQRILELYGAGVTLLQFRRRIETQIASSSQPNRHQLLGALEQGFNDDKVLDIVTRTFVEGSSEKQLDAWLAWLTCPIARRMIETEQRARDEDEERARFARKIERRSVPESRIALVGRLDELVGGTATDVEMHLTMNDALRDTYLILPGTPVQSETDSIPETIESKLRDENRTTLLFAYQLLDVDELWGYLSYWQTHLGQRLAELMKESLVAGARFAGESTMRALEQRVADSN